MVSENLTFSLLHLFYLFILLFFLPIYLFIYLFI